MRLKNVPGSQEAIEASSWVVTEPDAWKGRWQDIFPMGEMTESTHEQIGESAHEETGENTYEETGESTHEETGERIHEESENSAHERAAESSRVRMPLHIEIGMGKGSFLIGMAKAHPGVRYLGIEKYSSVLLRAMQKQEEERLPNLCLVRMDAQFITDSFETGEIDRIYLNFSDPWPKDRHAERRLTSGTFLSRYDRILKPGGLLEFKTDNAGLFEWSLESIEGHGWKISSVTRDLHRSSMAEGNIMTEYEEKFSSRGVPICKLIAEKPEI